MAENAAVIGEFATAKRLVDLLEEDGFRLDSAVWVPDDEGHGRLYLVPRDRSENNLRQTIRVAQTISKHKDDLPDRGDLQFSIVDPDHTVISAVRSVSGKAGKLHGLYKDGTYIDTAYVLRAAA